MPDAAHGVIEGPACEICGGTAARLTSGGKRWCLECGFLYS